jgi:hypothetical protein
VTGFASHAAHQVIKLKFGVDRDAGAMATEAVPRFIYADVTAQGFFQTRRCLERASDSPVQAINAV